MSVSTIKLLDHGSIRLVEAWGRGDDGTMEAAIVEAARQSTDSNFKGFGPLECDLCDGTKLEVRPDHVNQPCSQCFGRGDQPGDEKLLGFLYGNKHATPFEFAGCTIEVKAPIFVFREWHRHRMQSYNEMSARYAALPNENYIPTIERLMMNAKPPSACASCRGSGILFGGLFDEAKCQICKGTGVAKENKQAGTIAGAKVLDEAGAAGFQDRLRQSYDLAQAIYEGALLAGVPKELARVHLPVGRYSQMRAVTNLRNWLGFLTLRAAPQAQWEIRQYAQALHGILSSVFPRTLALFDEKGSL